MKRRVRKIANFFAFNLLFFALYLNFIHKDNVAVGTSPQSTQQPAAFSGTAFAETQDQTIEKNQVTNVAARQAGTNKVFESNTTPLKLSIN